jgi:hypothetical protein
VAAHLASGTYRKDRHARLSAGPIEKLPAAPRWLSSGAKVHYRRLAKDLAGRASRGDVSAVALVADALARAFASAEGAAAPTASERTAAWNSALRGLALFGLIPARRAANGSAAATPGVDLAAYVGVGSQR